METPLPELYDYEFPKELIASKPASPRDSAKLLVYARNDSKIRHDVFRNLRDYLPKGAVLVFNDTKVVPARFYANKITGGLVELLYLNHNEKFFSALSNKSLEKGSILTNGEMSFRVLEKLEKGYELEASSGVRNFLSWLQENGKTPIPPYIKNSPLSEKQLQKEYQTIFAKNSGSAAAPTASLHFTQELIQGLEESGLKTVYVTLHVGLGTFANITEENLKKMELHRESYEIPKKSAELLMKYKAEGRKIIAVGTTVTRTLESACKETGVIKKLSGDTCLFIAPGYEFKFVDGLVTNFHVPKSSLLMLVSALVGREELLKIYKEAILCRYRLFSFGDGMLII